MSAIINALFGAFMEPEQQNVIADTTQTVAEQSATSSECLHTSAVSDDVQVNSVISSQTQASAAIKTKLNIDGLLAQLSTTHAEVDKYSQTRTAEINEQVQKSIADVLANTQRQQEELIIDANRRHLIIDNEYKLQLQIAVEVLDNVKAKTLADLERDLQAKQQIILNEAKKQIDILNDQANAAKLNVLVEAQQQSKQNVSDLTDQVAAIGHQDTQHLLQSTTTTVITSQTQATGNTEITVTQITNQQQGTTTTDNQLQVAIRSPSELVLVPTSPTTSPAHSTAADIINGSPVLTPAEIEGVLGTTHPATTTTTVETAVKPPQDNKIVQPKLTATEIINGSPVLTPAEIDRVMATTRPTSKTTAVETAVKPPQDNVTVQAQSTAADIINGSPILTPAEIEDVLDTTHPATTTTAVETAVKPSQDNVTV